MKAYKGFNSDMTCRGFRFAEGEEYREEEADLCNCGFHACLAPLDVFRYYAPAKSVYHEVELDEVSSRRENYDTKVCGKQIKIGAKIDIAGLCKAQFDYVYQNCTNEKNAEKGGVGHGGRLRRSHSRLRRRSHGGQPRRSHSGRQRCSHSRLRRRSHGAATAGDNGAATSGGTATVGMGGAALVRGEDVKARRREVRR